LNAPLDPELESAMVFGGLTFEPEMCSPNSFKRVNVLCRYAVGEVINVALAKFREEVETGAFPSASFSPYKVGQEDAVKLAELLKSQGLGGAAAAVLEVVEEENNAAK
jgi:hypothetical protein